MLILGQIRPDGIAAPAGRGLAVLDGLAGTFIDTAQALEALRRPDGLSILEGNGVSRTISGTLAASVAAVLGKKGLCASGKFVESEVGEMGFHPCQPALMDTVYPLLPPDLLGHLLQRLPGGGDLLADLPFLIGIGADNVVVGHQQAVAAAQRVQLGKTLHGKSGVPSAGTDAEGKRLALGQFFRKLRHNLRHAPGIDRKDKAHLCGTPGIRQLFQVGDIIGLIAGKPGQLPGRPRRVARSRKIENHVIYARFLCLISHFKYKRYHTVSTPACQWQTPGRAPPKGLGRGENPAAICAINRSLIILSILKKGFIPNTVMSAILIPNFLKRTAVTAREVPMQKALTAVHSDMEKSGQEIQNIGG